MSRAKQHRTLAHLGFGLAVLVAVMLGGGCSTPGIQEQAGLLPALQPSAQQIASELDQVPPDRRPMLQEIADTILHQLQTGQPANLTFICTHNSRRSHMSQIWAQTAAYHYGLRNVFAFSGGTQATACNCRTVAAMRRVGFDIQDATTGDNPIYLVRYAQDRPAIRAYSKLYNADGNPSTNYIALMTCSVADKTCPVVQGAIARFPIHYADPRLCDDTPTETTAYNERCHEIGREMFYIMAQVHEQLNANRIAARK